MTTAGQLRGSRALLGLDQRELHALEAAGIVLIGENAASPSGGRSVRLNAKRK